MALKNAIKSKNYVRQLHPSIERLWPAFGLPDVVVCDRALEFTGRSFELACAELSIEVAWCPRKTPQWKGIIERTIFTINTNFVELLPGSTKGDARKLTKQERDPSAEAEISNEELSYNFHKWVSLEKDAPISRAVEVAGHILCRPILGGLHHQYVRI